MSVSSSMIFQSPCVTCLAQSSVLCDTDSGKTPNLQMTPKAAQLFSHCLFLEATVEMEHLLGKVNQGTFHKRGKGDTFDQLFDRRELSPNSAFNVPVYHEDVPGRTNMSPLSGRTPFVPFTQTQSFHVSMTPSFPWLP